MPVRLELLDIIEYMPEFEPDYRTFIASVEGKIKDTLPPDQEIPATPKEVGWWKQHQFKRSLNHLGRGIATGTELGYLRKKGGIVPSGIAIHRIAGKE